MLVTLVMTASDACATAAGAGVEGACGGGDDARS